MAKFLAQVDCLLGFAVVAAENDYRCPQMNTEGRLSIEDGRHPVVEKLLSGERFVPNSVRMDDDACQVLMITGPNMAGKSTVLRQMALIVLLAHVGSFVPARAAEVSITDRIFTRVGALDNLAAGQSTFMMEMQETANILNNATRRSLVILDEIGRGTSTFDGLSIAWAVAEYLHDQRNKGVKTLFATHYHELTELARQKSRIKNFNIAVKEWNEEIIFLRKLMPGGTNRSYGIQVARLAGVPKSVITRARKILARIENGGSLKVKDNDVPLSGGTIPGSHIQLELFQRPEQKIAGKLKALDLSKMTPLDALNWLSEQQAELKHEQPGGKE
jgi:DNA mismatch repair protein MutS